MRGAPPALACALLAACLVAQGCNELSIDGPENPYTGGSIPWGKGPVVAAGYVVDGSRDRAPLAGMTVEAVDSRGVTRRNRSDRRGIYYLDGIAAGLTRLSVTGNDRYLPFSCAVEAPAGARLTASLSVYPGEAAPDYGSGDTLGEFRLDLPAQTGSGGPATEPGLPDAFAPYGGLMSFVCVTDSAACVDRRGALLALGPGAATLHAFFEGAHSEDTIQVLGPD